MLISLDEVITAPTEFNLTNVTDSCLLTACTNRMNIYSGMAIIQRLLVTS